MKGEHPIKAEYRVQDVIDYSGLEPDGLFLESLMAAIAQGDDAAKQRVRAFLDGRAAKVLKN